MTSDRLSPELTSLLNYVELNETGWCDKAIKQILLAAFWLKDQVTDKKDISRIIHDTFYIDIPAQRLSEQFDKLYQEEAIVQQTDNTFSLSYERKNELEGTFKAADLTEKETKQLFLDITGESCPLIDLEQCWSMFHELFLVPLVKELGARTYELFSGSNQPIYNIPATSKFFDAFEKKTKPGLQLAVGTFLDPKNVVVRKYVLAYLQSYFLINAVSLDDETITKLAQYRKTKPILKLFIDTNFMFSLLDLHENPSNEASKLLLDLVQRTSRFLDIKLYIHPLTIEEAKRVLFAVRRDFTDIRLVPSMAEAVLEGNLSSIAMRFARACQESGKPLSSDEYFDPYITNLTGILQSKNVELYNAPYSSYLTRQDVTDDINVRIEKGWDKLSQPEQQAKYKSAEHDIVLWHISQDLRPTLIENSLDAIYWIITNDYGFIRYDSQKRRNDQTNPAVCLHPLDIVQMLQLWAPRDSSMEEALLGTLRLPFLFYEYDSQAENVTLKILRSLSRFENLDDLSAQSISEVLTTKALRNNISGVSNKDKELTLVRETFVDINKEMNIALDESKEQIENLKDQLEKEKTHRENQSQEISRIQKGLEDRQKEADLKKVYSQFIRRWIVLPSSIGVIIVTGGSLLLSLLPKVHLWHGLVGSSALSAFFWFIYIYPIGRKTPAILNTKWFTRVSKVRKKVMYALGVIMLTLIGNVIWTFIQNF